MPEMLMGSIMCLLENLSDIVLEEGKFDVVIMNHLIEHLGDPQYQSAQN